MKITEEKLNGYFNWEEEGYRVEYGPADWVRHAYPCLMCYSLVVSIHARDHVAWHEGVRKADKDMSPEEIRKAARRERSA